LVALGEALPSRFNQPSLGTNLVRVRCAAAR
jgi:hypothetical protein